MLKDTFSWGYANEVFWANIRGQIYFIKKKLCFGGYFKGSWAWTWEVYFLSVQQFFKLPGSTCCWSLPASWWVPRQSLSHAHVTWNPHALANAVSPGEAWSFGGWNAQSLRWDVLLRNSVHDVNLARDRAILPLFFFLFHKSCMWCASQWYVSSYVVALRLHVWEHSISEMIYKHGCGGWWHFICEKKRHMFAVWCVPVDQNPMKSELTTSVIGVLLTQKKKEKGRKMLNAMWR